MESIEFGDVVCSIEIIGLEGDKYDTIFSLGLSFTLFMGGNLIPVNNYVIIIDNKNKTKKNKTKKDKTKTKDFNKNTISVNSETDLIIKFIELVEENNVKMMIGWGLLYFEYKMLQQRSYALGIIDRLSTIGLVDYNCKNNYYKTNGIIKVDIYAFNVMYRGENGNLDDIVKFYLPTKSLYISDDINIHEPQKIYNCQLEICKIYNKLFLIFDIWNQTLLFEKHKKEQERTNFKEMFHKVL